MYTPLVTFALMMTAIISSDSEESLQSAGSSQSTIDTRRNFEAPREPLMIKPIKRLKSLCCFTDDSDVPCRSLFLKEIMEKAAKKLSDKEYRETKRDGFLRQQVDSIVVDRNRRVFKHTVTLQYDKQQGQWYALHVEQEKNADGQTTELQRLSPQKGSLTGAHWIKSGFRPGGKLIKL